MDTQAVPDVDLFIELDNIPNEPIDTLWVLDFSNGENWFGALVISRPGPRLFRARLTSDQYGPLAGCALSWKTRVFSHPRAQSKMSGRIIATVRTTARLVFSVQERSWAPPTDTGRT